MPVAAVGISAVSYIPTEALERERFSFERAGIGIAARKLQPSPGECLMAAANSLRQSSAAGAALLLRLPVALSGGVRCVSLM